MRIALQMGLASSGRICYSIGDNHPATYESQKLHPGFHQLSLRTTAFWLSFNYPDAMPDTEVSAVYKPNLHNSIAFSFPFRDKAVIRRRGLTPRNRPGHAIKKEAPIYRCGLRCGSVETCRNTAATYARGGEADS